LVDLAAGFAWKSSWCFILEGPPLVAGLASVERNADESDLVEDILIVYMVVPKNQPYKLGLDFVYVGLLEFSSLKVSINVRIQ